MLKSTITKRINKSLNKELSLSLICNDIYLKIEVIVSIIKINSKVCELKIYNKIIADLIYSIKWQQVIKKEIYNLKIYYT